VCLTPAYGALLERLYSLSRGARRELGAGSLPRRARPGAVVRTMGRGARKLHHCTPYNLPHHLKINRNYPKFHTFPF